MKEKRTLAAQRIAAISRQTEQVFHTGDLGNLWNIQNKNTLYTILKRYIKNDLLFRIYKGFYSLIPAEKLDPILLGAKAIHRFCYLTAETVLFQKSYISQKVNVFTFVSEKSFKFTIGNYQFKSRELADKFLYNSEGVMLFKNIKIATLERAIADMLYFNPFCHFDRPVNWRAIKLMQQKIGYPLTPNRYDFTSSR